MNNNYKRNLSFGFGLSLLILLISTIASYISINSLLDSSDQVTNTNAFIKELDNVGNILVDAETGQRGFLLTGENVFLDPYRGASTKATASLEKIRAFIVDRPSQQENYISLEKFANERLNILRDMIELKRTGKAIILADLKNGKIHMDEVRRLISVMETNAQKSLEERTSRLNRFAIYTRIMIVVASLLALLITVIFYLKLKKDFDARMKLQLEMVEKDRSISERIRMIHEIANKISLGNYQIRITNEAKDTLGSLADSLNKMASSLEHSFSLLSDKEWLQTGASELNDRMVGENDQFQLCENVINYLVQYTGSQVGAMYIIENEAALQLCASYGLSTEGSKKILSMGEGLAGQCAYDGKTQLLEDIKDDSVVINYAAGVLRPKNIIALPLINENVIKGVIELANIRPFTKRELAYLELVSSRVAGIINRMQIRVKMQELLEETQSQTEELHTQHNELQNLNAELEANTQKLQSSEEELRIQQEELLTANTELKQRAYLLEEKNQMIQERNTEIQRKAEELETTTRYKSEFLANMSHELRTPLNSILLLSGLMISNTEKNTGEEYVEYARVIQSSGNGLLALIDEILDLSKIESGKMQIDYEHVDIEDLASSMRAMFKPFAGQKEIDFQIQLSPGIPATVETDRMRLEQILKNLLSNAFKFTPASGKISLTVAIAPNDPHFISFSVKDNGIGIAKDKQSLIFEAFQQEDGSTRRKFGGTGLGLSISKELVKLLKGRFDLNSEVGQGSEFTVSIPLLAETFNRILPQPVDPIPDAIAIAVADKQPVRSTSYKIEDDRTDLMPNDKLLLIVEDDLSLAKVLLNFTRSNGYKGIVATRGDEAIDLAKQFKPHGVLLDIHLPVKNGWEVMDALKHDAETMNIPVHIMSSNNFQKESLLKGADDFIDKPVEFDKIRNIFERLKRSPARKEKKVLIVEEDSKHASALAYYLITSKINAKIKNSLEEGIYSLLNEDIECVILDKIGSSDTIQEKLEEVRKTSGLESTPIIVFTSKNITKKEEEQLKKYASTMVVRTAYSYKRILDEVSIFLHVVEGDKKPVIINEPCNKLGALGDVLKNKTVLVADDDVRNIFSLTKALETYKVKVVTAMDGKEALQRLEENPFIDIILMDMMMPEMDGYDATIQIKKDLRYRDIPVIAVTAKAMIGDREKCIEAGASDYITKPVDIDQLLSLLRVWLYEKQFSKTNTGSLPVA